MGPLLTYIDEYEKENPSNSYLFPFLFHVILIYPFIIYGRET